MQAGDEIRPKSSIILTILAVFNILTGSEINNTGSQKSRLRGGPRVLDPHDLNRIMPA
jgi:hypothetical protein